jgi:hypothetical protein
MGVSALLWFTTRLSHDPDYLADRALRELRLYNAWHVDMSESSWSRDVPVLLLTVRLGLY